MSFVKNYNGYSIEFKFKTGEQKNLTAKQRNQINYILEN